MPEFGFPQFPVVASLSYFSREKDFHPQSLVAVPQPSQADTKGILMMFLPCQRLPTISKSSFAIKCLNSLLGLVTLTLSKCLLCPNTKPAYPSSCAAKFSETFGIDAKSRREQAQSGHRVQGTWEPFRAQLKATPCSQRGRLYTVPRIRHST